MKSISAIEWPEHATKFLDHEAIQYLDWMENARPCGLSKTYVAAMAHRDLLYITFVYSDILEKLFRYVPNGTDSQMSLALRRYIARMGGGDDPEGYGGIETGWRGKDNVTLRVLRGSRMSIWGLRTHMESVWHHYNLETEWISESIARWTNERNAPPKKKTQQNKQTVVPKRRFKVRRFDQV